MGKTVMSPHLFLSKIYLFQIYCFHNKIIMPISITVLGLPFTKSVLSECKPTFIPFSEILFFYTEKGLVQASMGL